MIPPLLITSSSGDDAASLPIMTFRPRLVDFVASAGLTAQRFGNTTLVTVTPILTGDVYYFWYLDGSYRGRTASPTKTFVLPFGSQARIDVLQSKNPNFNPLANAPLIYPASRTLEFIRSVDPTIERYRIEQKAGSGAWTILGYVKDYPSQWSYQYHTARLLDLTTYSWRVTALDSAGNAGTPVSLGAELIVRVPDSPDFTATFQTGADEILFAAAS